MKLNTEFAEIAIIQFKSCSASFVEVDRGDGRFSSASGRQEASTTRVPPG